MFLLKWLAPLSAILIFLLALIVFMPRAIYGTPKGNWLTFNVDETCRLPCWRGITLGLTSLQEGRARLERMPDIRFVTIPTSKLYLGQFVIRTPYGIVVGELNPKIKDGGIVLGVIGGIPLFSDMPYLGHWDNIVNQVGNPDIYTIQDGPNGVEVTFAFEKQLLIMGTRLASWDVDAICSSKNQSFPVNSIYIFDTDSFGPFTNWHKYKDINSALCDPNH